MIRGDWSFRNIARWERQLATAIRRWRTLATRGWQQDPMRRHRRSLLFDGKRNIEESENDREPDPPHEHLGGGWLAGV
jgi:hypothetical protein